MHPDRNKQLLFYSTTWLDSWLRYYREYVGFWYTLVLNSSSSLITKSYKKGSLPSCFISIINLIIGWLLLTRLRKTPNSSSPPAYMMNVYLIKFFRLVIFVVIVLDSNHSTYIFTITGDSEAPQSETIVCTYNLYLTGKTPIGRVLPQVVYLIGLEIYRLIVVVSLWCGVVHLWENLCTTSKLASHIPVPVVWLLGALQNYWNYLISTFPCKCSVDIWRADRLMHLWRWWWIKSSI